MGFFPLTPNTATLILALRVFSALQGPANFKSVSFWLQKIQKDIFFSEFMVRKKIEVLERRARFEFSAESADGFKPGPQTDADLGVASSQRPVQNQCPHPGSMDTTPVPLQVIVRAYVEV